MKIWHISDTHGEHRKLKVPNCELVIHSGDASNYRDPARNFAEMWDFLEWFGNIKRPKIYVAGNHDTSIENGLITPEDFRNRNIHYLRNESMTFRGYKIYGSPYTPKFFDWAFNLSDQGLSKCWDMIPDDINFLVTHGPAYGLLDFTLNRNKLVHVGDNFLLKKMKTLNNLQLHCFGHIHNEEQIPYNSGILNSSYYPFISSNGSCVTTGNRKIGQEISSGNIIRI